MITEDGGRPTGRLPRIPAANATIVDAAIAERDIKQILGIRDTRGSHGADKTSLEAVISECYSKNELVSTRQIRKEAKRRGLQADRGRIEKLRGQLNLGINKAAAGKQRVRPHNVLPTPLSAPPRKSFTLPIGETILKRRSVC